MFRAAEILQSACAEMETEYDKLVSIKTKGELNGFDKNLGLTLNVKINSLDTELCNS